MNYIMCKDCVWCYQGRCVKFGFPVDKDTGIRLPFCKSGQKL